MICNIHAFAHRLTALSMAFLASTGLIFCALSGFGCSFIEIQSLPGRNIGNFNGEVFENLQTAFLGVQCKTGADDLFYNCNNNNDNKDECGNDRLWDISRLFLYISLVFGGTTVLIAWCLSSCVRPTACRWRVLSIFAACSAVFQIPVFLVFESNNCNFDITRQTCKFSTGAYLNIVSVSIWIIMTIWVQLLRAPRWDEELDTWRVNVRNGGERERGIIMPVTKSNNSVETFCNATEETDFALSPTGTQRSPLHSNITPRENTIASNSYMGSPGIMCSAMPRIIGNDDEDDVENFGSNYFENQDRKKQSKCKIRRSSSLVRETTKPKKYLPSGCAILPPSIDQILTKEDIEVTAVQDAFCVGEAKAVASNIIREKESGCHNNNRNKSDRGGKNINAISDLWGGSRKRSKSTGNISRSAVNIIYDNKVKTSDDSKNYGHEMSNSAAAVIMESLIKDITLPKIEISSRSGKESSSCPQSSHEVRNIADKSDKDILTSRTAPGFKISCVYADGTRHDAHFPPISSYCMGMVTNSDEEGEEFRTFHHDHPVTFQEADENNNTNDAHYLAKKLRKAEDAAATRKARRKMAPVASFEFENSSSLIAEGNDNNNNNCDSINDDISEMTRGSGLASGVSELLDDTDLRHTSREILDDLARTY